MTVLDDACREQTRSVLANHSDVTLMWRDQASFDRSRQYFPNIRALLVPDAAFCLHPVPVPKVTFRPRAQITSLARRDRESAGLADVRSDATVARDWESVVPEKIVRRLLRLGILVERRAPHMKVRAFLFRRFAHLNGRSAARQLTSSRVVIVDRLHGWILSVLLDVPHVVVETKYRKISGVMRTWLPSELSTIAADPVESVSLARHALVNR
jgi:exopolysaccharide biosynthesis protein PssK